MGLEIITGGETVKTTNTWWLNNRLLNNQWVTEEIKEEIKKYLDKNVYRRITELLCCIAEIGTAL